MANPRRWFRFPIPFPAPILALLLLVACAAPSSGPGRQALDDGNLAEAIELLSATVITNPDDWRARRDLGVAYLRTRNAKSARDHLEAARSSAPADPSTLFHLGACYESLNRPDDAVAAYTSFVQVGRDSDFRDRVELRLRWFARQQAVRDAQSLVAREDSLDTSATVDSRTLTVTHFGAVGTRDEVAPLGAALSEWLVSDLAKVKSANLVIVERMRLDAILRELELSQTAYVDSATAPRVGRLLAVNRVVSGALVGSAEDRVRADLQLTATETGVTQGGGTAEGSIDGFVALEKALAFQLLDALGVTPTEFERAQIEQVPTRDLRAVLAYGTGLIYERQGLLEEAKASYQTALDYDAGFGLAGIALQDAVVDPGSLDALLTAAGTEFSGSGGGGDNDTGGLDGLGSRLEDTGNLIDGDFWPTHSRDTRANPFPVQIPTPPRDQGGRQ